MDDPLAKTTWTSHDQYEVLIPGALNVELDIPTFALSSFAFGSQVRVWGVGLSALSQASNLSGYGIQINAGMLPPYNLNQTPSGQIISGQIFQGYGNWEGVNQYLDLVLSSKYIIPYKYADIPFDYKANTPLINAITTALQTAFGAGVVIDNSSSAPSIGHDISGHYPDLTTFAKMITDNTATSSYSGVQMAMNGDTIYIFDSNSEQSVINLNFPDLIGQPTWIDPVSVQFATVMRSDITIGDAVVFPKGIYPPYALTTPTAAFPQSPSVNKSSFDGTFLVKEVHHYGNFRQADATSWRTEFKASFIGELGFQLPAELYSYANVS